MDDLDALEALPTGEWATSGHRVFVANGPHVADFVSEHEAERAVASVNALPDLLAELRRLRGVEEKARAYEAAVIDLEQPGPTAADEYMRRVNAFHKAKAALWAALESA